MLYTDLSARVIWGTNLADEFKSETGVKQGVCFLSCSSHSALTASCKKSSKTSEIMSEMLGDIGFAYDTAMLLSHR